MARRVYEINNIFINEHLITKVVIDSHYKEKHSASINDELILKLVNKLNGRVEIPSTVSAGYSYFATKVELDKKQYRLIWLLEEKQIYIGVVNAFRDSSKGEIE